MSSLQHTLDRDGMSTLSKQAVVISAPGHEPGVLILASGVQVTAMRILLALAILAPLAAHAADITGRVTRVTDGDTFRIGDVTIRVCGIDAPELRHAGGPAAKAALAAMIEGADVRCVPVGQGTVCDHRSPAKSHGRIVAQCFVGAADIAARMVQAGQACDWHKFSGGVYKGGAVCP